MPQDQSSTNDLPLLRHDSEKGVSRLLMNRPKQYNALSTEMMTALEAALADIGSDSSVRAVILQGAGRGFCAGHDLREVRNRDRADLQPIFQQCSRLMQAILELPQPVIAQVHGVATAAGCQLVATCDLAVAANSARFGTPGVNIGLFCSTPAVAIARNIPRKRIMEMLLLGETFSAQQAADFGLINRAVDEEELESVSQAMAEQIAAKSSLTLTMGKRAFYRQIELPTREAYMHASEVMTDNMLSRDANEGVGAFIEKRTPSWEDR